MKVVIPQEVYAKIMYWMKKAEPNEVSGLGMVSVEGDTFTVTDVCLLEQRNSSATTDITPEGVGKALFEFKDKAGSLKFWWHSHVNMKAFFSGTDVTTIKEMGDNGWCLATVFNLSGEYLTDFYHKAHGVCPPAHFKDVPTSISYVPTKEEESTWEAEFNKKVMVKTHNYYGGTYGGKSTHHGREINGDKLEYYMETNLDGTMVDFDGYVCKLDVLLVADVEDYFIETKDEYPTTYRQLDKFYKKVKNAPKFKEWLAEQREEFWEGYDYSKGIQ